MPKTAVLSVHLKSYGGVLPNHPINYNIPTLAGIFTTNKLKVVSDLTFETAASQAKKSLHAPLD